MKNSPIPLWSKTWAGERQIPHFFFSSTTSVNDLARESAFKGAASPTLFITSAQTAGRGRHQRIWKDSDLMISWLWEGKSASSAVSGLDEKFVLDLLHSVQKVWPFLPWKLKKPNDLYLQNKKTAGILLEVLDQSPKRALVSGLGFNVFSHPPVPGAGHLGEAVPNTSQQTWNRFLDQLHFLWTKRATDIFTH